jgi:protein ImuA
MSLTAAGALAALRRRLAAIEAAKVSFAPARPSGPDGGPLSFCGSPGPFPGDLHEIAAVRESEIAAATAFALPLAAWAAKARATLWIAQDMTLAENGALYGPALETFGLRPERLVQVTAPHARDVLWAMEEALRCRSAGAVIGEIRGRGVDLTASRRLSLAAQHGGTAAFLLRTAPAQEPIAAVMRWIVGAAPSAWRAHEPGPPRLHVRLTRNRRGNPGTWLLEWNSADQRFDIATTDRQPLAETDLDRPARAAASA